MISGTVMVDIKCQVTHAILLLVVDDIYINEDTLNPLASNVFPFSVFFGLWHSMLLIHVLTGKYLYRGTVCARREAYNPVPSLALDPFYHSDWRTSKSNSIQDETFDSTLLTAIRSS